ncbi:unnamed protein product [Blepharisma stoltei]|uniref:Uncharacterized protein n=1 Tax=Blepharisma stoltei TaxID=1481888 RepID=A0AAU9JW52_9CILI|nr:unnamed protein product [Blepharisma stoltei]
MKFFYQNIKKEPCSIGMDNFRRMSLPFVQNSMHRSIFIMNSQFFASYVDIDFAHSSYLNKKTIKTVVFIKNIQEFVRKIVKLIVITVK